ncbi:hypothetical protein [Nevskia soli]|uniref:hypothetical protein n=1 Tax=Nevskia soli TaxID=418856 RepID=UPI001C5CA479|nr:hypothetical protein [Nevskia soli]
MLRRILIALPLLSFIAAAQTPVVTYHNDTFRTGWYHNETTLTPGNVNETTFGKLFTMPADGKVDAQPLYVPGLTINGASHNVTFVATENDTVYAYDADTSGSPLWQSTMLLSGESPSDPVNGCSQVVPEIGVTATPAIDLKVGPHGTIYVVAMSKNSSGNYFQRLHALDITTGAEQFGGPVTIQATYPGTGDGSSNGQVIFNAEKYEDRAALLIVNGSVVFGFTSHCDNPPYTGWVMAYSETTLAQISVLNVTPNGGEGSMWESGNGPAADSLGNIYYLSANGTFDTTLNASGFPDQGDFGNAFLKLSYADNKLAVADYFTMYNTVHESSTDTDLGSGGAMLMPAVKDSTGTSHQLAVGAGKDTNIYIVDRTNLGKYNSTTNNVFQEIAGGIVGGAWSSPAYFPNRFFYGGVGDHIRSWNWNGTEFAAGTITAHTFTYPGVTPAVSSNGLTSSILWAVEDTSPAVLWAYSALNLTKVLYNSNQAGTRDQFGDGNKFITPMIANGKVYVGTPNSVVVFGLFAAPKASLGNVPSTLR